MEQKHTFFKLTLWVDEYTPVSVNFTNDWTDIQIESIIRGWKQVHSKANIDLVLYVEVDSVLANGKCEQELAVYVESCTHPDWNTDDIVMAVRKAVRGTDWHAHEETMKEIHETNGLVED